MSDRLRALERAISELSPEELQEFSAWFADFDDALWEAKIKSDAELGRLDFLKKEAEEDARSGRLHEL